MVNLCISNICLKDVPKDRINISAVVKDIAKHPEAVSLEELAENISEGYTFCPCTFTKPEKKKEYIKQMQIFALDFDGEAGTKDPCPLKFSEALSRAQKYHLPVVIAYETKSSVDFGRYRLVFNYNEPVLDTRMMNVINRLLLCVFPEADQSTSDLSKMFFPGRNVHYFGDDVFYIDSLAFAAEAVVKEKLSNCWNNRIKRIVNNTGIVVKGQNIHISFYEEDTEFEAYPVQTYINILDFSHADLLKNSPDTLYNNTVSGLNLRNKPCVFFSKKPTILKKSTIKDSPNYTHNIKFDSFTSESCMLLNEFLAGERKLEHSEWIGLMSNLIHIEGGQTIFLNTIDKYSELYDNPDVRVQQMRYFINEGYFPYRCESYCPYADICQHEHNMIATLKKSKHSIKKLPGEQKYYNIESVRVELKQEIEAAAQRYNTFSVIKTQTGVGKTRAALEFMLHSSRRVIIAFPNLNLMHEVYVQAMSMGIHAMCTSSIYDILDCLSPAEREEIERYYNNGAMFAPIKLLETYSKTNPTVAEHLEWNKHIQSFKGHIFTTHAKLLTMGSVIKSDDIVFIDEDISMQLLQCKCISEKELTELMQFTYKTDKHYIYNKLNTLFHEAKAHNSITHLSPVLMMPDDQDNLMEILNRHNMTFNGCIIGAITSQSYYYDPYKKNFIFLLRNSIPYPGTYIMLSATANQVICRKLYSNMGFCFHECAKVKYMGRVKLYADKTYSRTCIKNEPDLIEKIVKKHPDNCFISFMNEMNRIDVPVNQKLYFGKALGTNLFTGKDITIIGTPHVPEFVYKLVADALNYPSTSTLAVRKTQYAGFLFELSTFDDSFMREIQSLFISTELEQAVGRARLISNDCVVSLYSAFPVEQADITERE